MSVRKANEFILSNSECNKFTGEGVRSPRTLRRAAARRSLGRVGIRTQLYSDWTFEELKSYAEKLGIDHGFSKDLASTELRRQQVIRAIEAGNAASAR